MIEYDIKIKIRPKGNRWKGNITIKNKRYKGEVKDISLVDLFNNINETASKSFNFKYVFVKEGEK